MCFESILKISHSDYLQFCSNLPVKFAIFFKSSLIFSVFIVFSVYKQTSWFNVLKTRTGVNAKTLVFVIVSKQSYICYYIICMTVLLSQNQCMIVI